MKPSIGRIVMYHPRESDNSPTSLVAAIITRVWSDTVVNLIVFYDTGAPTSLTSVTFEQEEYGWTWPERV